MIKKNLIAVYFLRITFINLLGILFLSDTISFEQGLISIQSLIYSLNKYFFLLFILTETIFSFLQEYGLNVEFLYLIIRNFLSLNFKYNFFVLYQKYNYLIFLFVTALYIFYFEKKILANFKLFYKLKFIISIILLSSLIFIFQMERLELYFSKIKNYQDLTYKYNLFRNDNWFLKTKSYLTYEKNSKTERFKNIYFSKLINSNYNNIYVIINESYPLFKNDYLKSNMLRELMGDDLTVKIHKKNWNKKYSTQGAEIEFFCDSDRNFEKFKMNFDNFIKDCWINNLKLKNRVFIHTYKKTFFGRDRYNNFFNEMFFLNELEKLKYEKCPGMYEGICDYEVLKNFEKFIKKDNNFLVFLTLQNHHPTQLYPLINKNKMKICKDIYPLNINDQFCYLYLNQSYFNKLIYENVAKSMKQNDILLFISDTPPAFIKKWKIFFEDYVEVIKITKK